LFSDKSIHFSNPSFSRSSLSLIRICTVRPVWYPNTRLFSERRYPYPI
jgi:hypothetical protein